MKAKRIIMHNVMGITDLEITPGNVTVVSGKNATGKTSIMSGIAAIVNGGHDAHLLRKGETEGEAVIVFDDGVTITKSFTAEKSSVSVEVDERKLSSPASLIKELFGTGFNPVTFLTMPDKDRAGEILKNIPITLDRDVIDPILDKFKIEDVDFNQHPLRVLDSIIKALYDSRTGYNRIVKDAEATKTTLRKSLIAVDANAKTRMAELEAEKESLQNAIAKANRDRDTALATLTQDLSDEIEKLRIAYDEKKDKVRKAYELDVSATNTQMSQVSGAIAELAEQVKLAERQAYTKEQIDQTEEKIQKNNKIALSLEAAMNHIKAYKTQLAESVSIAGHKISIVDGSLFIDDLPYAKLNTAAKVQIAVAIAELNLGKARFAVIDGAECLDSESLELLATEATAKDIQLLVFAVGEESSLSFHEVTPKEPEEIY